MLGLLSLSATLIVVSAPSVIVIVLLVPDTVLPRSCNSLVALVSTPDSPEPSPRYAVAFTVPLTSNSETGEGFPIPTLPPSIKRLSFPVSCNLISLSVAASFEKSRYGVPVPLNSIDAPWSVCNTAPALPHLMLPFTSSFSAGIAVPMPTLPVP